jgi:hypothetical protein
MRRTRFCSVCGEPMKSKSVSLLVLGSLCARCSPRFRRERTLVVVAFLLCLSVVFAIARLTAPRTPFYFIGTPVELKGDSLASSNKRANSPPSASSDAASGAGQGALLTDAPHSSPSVCGAPTKSGRPCQRRVKDEGYCWQHREKWRPKSPALNGR